MAHSFLRFVGPTISLHHSKLRNAGPSQLALDCRAQVAAERGSSWPPALKKRGRPSLDEQWIRLVQRSLQQDVDWPHDVTNVRPAWWSPGLAKPELTEADIVQALAQETEFERVHVDTPRKWKSSEYAVAVNVAAMRRFKCRMRHHATETLMHAMGD
eukprot:674125-Amphidinium_carterae.2